MADRAVWIGGVQIGLLNLPIRLTTAVKDSTTNFKMISPCCNDFVGYPATCKGCGKTVDRADVKKGYKVGDTVVIMSQAEIKELLPNTTKTIIIKGFATEGEVSWLSNKKPFFASPNLDPKKGGSPNALKVYQLIVSQLALKGMVAFGSYVSQGRGSKEHQIILRPYQGRLVLQQLWNFDEVKNPPEIAPCEITDRERELGGKLVEKLTEKFDLSKFVNTYQQKVNELITARAMGKEAPILEKPPTPTIDNIEKALEATVEAVA